MAALADACRTRDRLQTLEAQWNVGRGAAGQQDLDKRLTRIEEWRTAVNGIHGEGQRFTRADGDALRRDLVALERRLDRLGVSR
jgi:hypothetical protein